MRIRVVTFLSGIRIIRILHCLVGLTIFSTGTAWGLFGVAGVAPKDAPLPRRVPSFPLPSAKEAEIQQTLDSSGSVDWNDLSLEEALNALQSNHGLQIWLDKAALNDEEIDLHESVTLVVNNVPLKKVLQLVLEPLGLTYAIEDDVMKVTTQSKQDERVSTRVYPVGDLFETLDEAKELLETVECGLGMSRDADRVPRFALSARLKTLTVRESFSVQQKVQELLLALRDSQPVPAPAKDSRQH